MPSDRTFGSLGLVVESLLYEALGHNSAARMGFYNAWRPLHRACSAGQTGVVRLLLEKKANIESKTRFGSTALHVVAKHGHEAIVETLLDHDDSTLGSPEHKAVHIEHPKHGFNLLESRDVYGWTALHTATFEGQQDIVRTLLAYGADIEAETAYGWTPVFAAIAHEETLRILLDHGADPNAHNSYGSTALVQAARYGLEPIVKMLLQHGADWQIKTMYGDTALNEADGCEQHAVVEILKESPTRRSALEKCGQEIEPLDEALPSPNDFHRSSPAV